MCPNLPQNKECSKKKKNNVIRYALPNLTSTLEVFLKTLVVKLNIMATRI